MEGGAIHSLRAPRPLACQCWQFESDPRDSEVHLFHDYMRFEHPGADVQGPRMSNFADRVARRIIGEAHHRPVA